MKSHSLVKGLALAATLAFATGASADGMPRGSVKDAPYVAPFSWTGFYGGVNIGAARMEEDPFAVTAANPATAAFWNTACFAAGACPPGFGSNNGTGAIGGLQAGYNWQAGSFLLGFETDFQGSTARVSRSRFVPVTPVINPATAYTSSGNTDLEALGTIRARIGFLLSPTFLAYATGGFAYGELQQSWGQGYNGAAAAFGRDSGWTTGWTAGGGFEFAVAPRITIGAEYLFVSLDSPNGFVGGGVPGSTCTPAVCNFNIQGSDLDIHIARLKVNYKF